MKAVFSIIYEGKDVTNDLSDLVERIEFTDCLEGRAGSLSITFADHEQNFLKAWMPLAGDTMQVYLGVEGSALLDTQTFWVDEFSMSGSRGGSRCVIKSLSTSPKNIVTTPKRSSASQSLQTLANTVASQLGLTLKGNVSGNVVGNQNAANLQYLMQQCHRNGYILKVEGGNLVAYEYSKLRNSNSLKISLNDVVDWDYESKAEGRFAKCEVRWYDAQKKKLYSGVANAGGGGSTATIYEQVDSNEDAAKRAAKWLENRAKKEIDIRLRLAGDVRLLAGVAVELTDAGNINGKYVIKEARHQIDRDVLFETEITLQK